MNVSNQVSLFLKEMVDIQANMMITGENEKVIADIFQHLFSYYDEKAKVATIDIKKPSNISFRHLYFTSNEEYDALYYMQNVLRLNPDYILLHSLSEQTVSPFLEACHLDYTGSCSYVCADPKESLSFLQREVEKTNRVAKEEILAFIQNNIDIFLHGKETENGTTIEQIYCFDNHSYALQSIWNKETDTIDEKYISTTIQEKRQRFIESHTPIVEVPKVRKTILSKDYKTNANKFLSEYGKKHGINDLLERLSPVMQSAISMQRTLEKDTNIPIGASKFGGDPDLPSSIPYPHYEDIPYLFMAQINCEEVAPHDMEHKLPKKGMLYFFHLFEDDCIPMYFDKSDDFPKYEKSALVLYHEGDASELIRTKVPETEHFKPVRSASISFVTRFTIPKPSEVQSVYESLGYSRKEIWDEDHLEDIHAALPRLAFETPEDLLSDEESWLHFYDIPSHQLYGEPDFCQAYPLYEIEETIFPKANIQKKDYTLLIQFEVDEEINLEWAGDGGMYYYISAEDLANKNFNTVFSTMQCG